MPLLTVCGEPQIRAALVRYSSVRTRPLQVYPELSFRVSSLRPTLSAVTRRRTTGRPVTTLTLS